MLYLLEHRVIVAPAILGDGNRQTHASLFGEFECVGQQVLENLLQALRVGDQAARQARIGMYFECKPPVLRFMAEWASDHFKQAGEKDFFGFD